MDSQIQSSGSKLCNDELHVLKLLLSLSAIIAVCFAISRTHLSRLQSLYGLENQNGGFIGVDGSTDDDDEIQRWPEKLFVFGDSYAATGNLRKSLGRQYGITDPGRPAGRFRHGLILTDYLAKFLRLKSPVDYVWRHDFPDDCANGMNFAFGGSGVFSTNPKIPNMTLQIGYLRQLINDSFYAPGDLRSAAVLVTLSGNDYSFYLANSGSVSEIKNFIPSVVNQLVVNLKRIQLLGARMIVVGGLQPLGCLPRATIANGYKQCIGIENAAAGYHNLLLSQAVEKLNSAAKGPRFLLLDLYQAFQTAIDNRGEVKFGSPLTPCCIGIGSGNSCGTVAENGTELYAVCEDPSASFFWDNYHPTESGWKTVFGLVKNSVHQFFRD